MLDRCGTVQFQHLGRREPTVHVAHRGTDSAAETRAMQLPQHRHEQMPLRKVDQHEIFRTDGDASRRPIAGRAEIGGARKQWELACPCNSVTSTDRTHTRRNALYCLINK